MDQIMTLNEVSDLTRLSPATLRYLRHMGTGPRSGKLGRRIMYREADVRAWLDERFEDHPRNAA